MRPLLASFYALALATACVEDMPSPTTVEDLRVLGLSLERPELMAPSCEATPETIAVLTSEVTFRALLADPKGRGRPIQYELLACADAQDIPCSNAAERVRLSAGSTTAGELTLTLRPAVTRLEDDTLLVQRVRERDPYQGLGGLRLPLVLHVTAGEEDIHAQKLMVFNCPLVPGMTENRTPHLPGLRLEGELWHEEEMPVLRGEGPFVVEPEDFHALQEAYVVPSLKLEPVHLVESWEISWHATLGRMSPGETGGVDLGRSEPRHRVKWRPPKDASEQEVTFWAVVRDGRGGQSWLSRRARWVP
jgi:hypothetical protein